MTETEDTWRRQKRAVRDFALMRPRLISDQAWEPVPDQKEQPWPALVFGVQQMNYGVWTSQFDVVGDEAGNAGWSDETGTLYLTPAPPVDTEIRVIWKALYTADPETRTFPDFPIIWWSYIEDLTRAIELEDLAETNFGDVSEYSIGQKTFKRGNNDNALLLRAQQLRHRVQQALEEPLAEWE